MFEAIVRGFYNLNPELFKEDMNKDLLEKAIIKTTAILASRMRLDLRPKHGSRIDEKGQSSWYVIESSRPEHTS